MKVTFATLRTRLLDFDACTSALGTLRQYCYVKYIEANPDKPAPLGESNEACYSHMELDTGELWEELYRIARPDWMLWWWLYSQEFWLWPFGDIRMQTVVRLLTNMERRVDKDYGQVPLVRTLRKVLAQYLAGEFKCSQDMEAALWADPLIVEQLAMVRIWEDGSPLQQITLLAMGVTICATPASNIALICGEALKDNAERVYQECSPPDVTIFRETDDVLPTFRAARARWGSSALERAVREAQAAAYPHIPEGSP